MTVTGIWIWKRFGFWICIVFCNTIFGLDLNLKKLIYFIWKRLKVTVWSRLPWSGYAFTQGRNEVKWRPGKEARFAPPYLNLSSFESKFTVWWKYLWHCWDFWAPSAVIWRPHSDSAPWNYSPFPPSVMPLVVVATYFCGIKCLALLMRFRKLWYEVSMRKESYRKILVHVDCFILVSTGWSGEYWMNSEMLFQRFVGTAKQVESNQHGKWAGYAIILTET